MPLFRKILGILILSLVLTTTLVCRGGDRLPVVVAANPSVTAGQLTRNELRAIFAMRRATWEDGNPVQVFVLPDDNPLHRFFCKHILRIYPHQLRRIWDRNIFSGTGQAPIEVGDVHEMKERISATAGAIGYISEDLLDESLIRVEVP